MKNLRTVLKMELAKRDMDQESLASPLGLSQQAISDWAAKGRIPRKHWDYIRETLGIEPSEFTGNPQRIDNHASVTNSHQSVAATTGATITLNTDVDLAPTIAFNLTPKEYEAVQAIRSIGGRIIEAVILFDLYGNKAGLERCIADLLRAKSLTDR
jgi:hypothetical protein